MKKRLLIFVPLFLTLVILFSVFNPVVTKSESISHKVFRLHILANSDSPYDQDLKLLVRDEILELSKELFQNCASVKEAIRISNENLELLTAAADNVIAENGYPYRARVYTTREYFNTRYYENFTLPAGVYDSLKIEIGEGRGHNWWCVMFPSVCLPSCTDEFSEVLTEEEKEMIESNNYVIRFKVVEIYEKLKDKCSN